VGANPDPLPLLSARAVQTTATAIFIAPGECSMDTHGGRDLARPDVSTYTAFSHGALKAPLLYWETTKPPRLLDPGVPGYPLPRNWSFCFSRNPPPLVPTSSLPYRGFSRRFQWRSAGMLTR